jgi:hypothetical protein
MLLSHRDFNIYGLRLVWYQPSLSEIQAGFLVDLSNGTVQVIFVLVDLASGETPARPFLPALDENYRVQVTVEHNSTADWHASLVLQKLFERLGMVLNGE